MRLVRTVADESHRLAGVAQGERILHGRLLDDRLVAHQGDRRLIRLRDVHVVAVRDAEVMVEAVPRG